VYGAGRKTRCGKSNAPFQNGKLEARLSLATGLGHGSGDQGQTPWRRLLSAARTHAEATLRVASAGIQAIRAEVVAALIAAQQALAAEALFAVMADGDVAALHQVQLTPIDEWCFAGEIQRNHGKSIQTWMLLTVPST
jgi:hypothetical protein